MGADSKIEWTHHTFNPWWGCQRVSPGCENCYAETFAKRVGQKVWGPTADRRFFGEKHWQEPLKWNASAEKAGERRRVFCASMADVFEDRRDLDEHRARLWKLIEATPALDWLLLTKRPENMLALSAGLIERFSGVWPGNVWAGTTAEDQRRADERIPRLLEVPAVVRFVSYEPALGPLDFSGRRLEWLEPFKDTDAMLNRTPRVDWVIVGGESGPGARPFDVDWARSIVQQCREGSARVFVKQLGAVPVGQWGDPSGHPFKAPDRWMLGDRKGGDPAEWPGDLRVREFPAVRA